MNVIFYSDVWCMVYNVSSLFFSVYCAHISNQSAVITEVLLYILYIIVMLLYASTTPLEKYISPESAMIFNDMFMFSSH